jgi:bacterioferritin-associated ferredoxin
MFVCICHAVSDAEVKSAIDEGADSVAAVTRACKAGGDCGQCHEQIASLIGERSCGGMDRLIPLRGRAA